MKKTILAIVSLAVITTSSYAAEVNRYALFIGSNQGGVKRSQLLYASKDAQRLQQTMKEIGGVSQSNSLLLIDPDNLEINKAIDSLSQQILKTKQNGSRSEFLFYYSGHSDENGLLLGESSYNYSALKAAINQVPSDIHVVILDSCYSGSFIRSKGGQKTKPFLFDDSSIVQGHAYLSSSSETEYSQESDEIQSSYFTNAVITGLRGAADTSGDKKVTLNELYSYAFSETLKKTEDTNAGPQHPNYNITLVGSGDLVLSDFSESECILSISKDILGQVVLRDESGHLVSEINKKDNIPMLLALPQGSYSVSVITLDKTLQGSFALKKGDTYIISIDSLKIAPKKKTTVRGESLENNYGLPDNTLVLITTSIYEKSNRKYPAISWVLPFDFSMSLKFNPFMTKLSGSNQYNIRKDLTVPFCLPIEFDIGVSVFTKKDFTLSLGTLSCTDILHNHTNSTADHNFSPYLSCYWNFIDGTALEGLYGRVYPAYKVLEITNSAGSWYDYRTAEEIGCNTILFKNLCVTVYFRDIQFYKDNKVKNTIEVGYKVGFDLISPKSFEKVRKYRFD